MKTYTAIIVTAGLAGLLATASAQQTDAPEKKPSSAPVVPAGETGLRLNFRGVPLDMVLEYLSDAAGFTIVLDTPVARETCGAAAWYVAPSASNEEIAAAMTTRVGRSTCSDWR